MQVRVPTTESLLFNRFAGGITVVGLTLNLVCDTPLPTALNAVLLVAVAAITQMAVSRQRQGVADFALVSAAERRAYLTKSRRMLLVMIVSLAIVLFLTFASQSLLFKVGFGLPALALGSVAGYFDGLLALRHGEQIFPRS